jgi:hypothetical protein
VAEHVLARTGAEEESPKYARQRYYAAVLLTLAHESASFGDAQFLMEGKRYGSDVLEAIQGSVSAHLVAAAYYADHGRLWLSAANSDPESVDGDEGTVQQIPAGLAEFDLTATRGHLNTTLLMVYTRLGFASRANDFLRAMNGTSPINDLDQCNAFLTETQAPDGVRPWIYYSVFQYLVGSGEEKEAYLFGISARNAAAEESGADFDETFSNAIANWIENDSTYDFLCACATPLKFDPRQASCPDCFTDNIRFEAKPKTSE